MMHRAFTRMFWGFLITLIEIHFLFIDILPDPIGYVLICTGISAILPEFPIGKKAYNIAVLLGILSIPTVFVQQNSGGQLEGLFSVWGFYFLLVNLLTLILVFYVFQLMMQIAQLRGEGQLIHRTTVFFKTYMTAMLTINFLHPFTMNLYRDLLMGYVIVTVVIALILQITFLIWLFRFRKYDIYDEMA